MGQAGLYEFPGRVTPHSAKNVSRLLYRTLWRKPSTEEKQNAEDNRNMKRKLQTFINPPVASVLAFSVLAQPTDYRSQFMDL
jgi:hypothetical protein